jgi:hypothetical protein
MIITYPKSVLILYLRIQENLENICRIFDTGRRMISAEDAILELMQSEELVVTYKRSASATGAALSNALQTQSVWMKVILTSRILKVAVGISSCPYPSPGPTCKQFALSVLRSPQAKELAA